MKNFYGEPCGFTVNVAETLKSWYHPHRASEVLRHQYDYILEEHIRWGWTQKDVERAIADIFAEDGIFNEDPLRFGRIK